MSEPLMADGPVDHPSGRGLRALAIVALAAALVFTVIGVKQGSPILIGMGVAGILLAGVTWLSPAISAFLRIFIGIFAVEYVVFGAAVAVQDLDLWPAGYEDYTLPTSLPVTVAVFGLIAWAASHIPVIRIIARITDPYFETAERRPVRVWPLPAFTVRENLLARSLVTILVLINQAQVGISVRLSFFNRDWFNAIQEKNEPLFWSLLYTVFMVWALVYVASGILEYVLQSGLTIRWRQWLTSRYVDHWLEDGTHYKMALAGRNADNPDQRIAEDVRQFIELTYGFSIRMLATLSSLVSFSIILWTISSSFAIPGTSIVVPGFLFWVALIYAVLGTLVTHLIGRSLVPLNFAQQRYEADFRFSLARLREYGEQVALLEGELAERQLVMGRFGSVIRNFWQIVNVRKWLTAFTVTYGQISVIIPYVIVAPFYFLGKVQLGTMSQTAGAFSNVSGALTFFVDYYVNLAEYKSIVDRLNTFDGAIAQGRALGSTPPRIDILRSPGKDLGLDGLTVKLPDGRAIVRADGLRIEGGQATLLAGPSGSGKSTLLRAISGIWPYGEGRITVPQGASVMLLPQRPYIPIGSLRNAVTYPSVSGTYEDAAIADALRAARLPELVDRIDADGIWSATLSGGEQQRLAIARALLARPDWLFLDEATSALDEANEVALYRMLRERLPGTTIVSIGHRSTLVDLHTRRMEMAPGPDGIFTPRPLQEHATA